MLVLPHADSITVVTQSDHARLAHDLLRLWRADGLPAEPLRADLLLATAEHDCGWQGPDAAPLLDPRKQRPFDFRSYPDRERRLIWKETIDRLSSRSTTAMALAIRHAESIHSDRLGRPEWKGFFSDLAERSQEFAEGGTLDVRHLESLYRYLQMADLVSLGACGAIREQTLVFGEYEIAYSPGRITIDPLPYAGPLTLRFACRSLPRPRYSEAAVLSADLAAARWRYESVRVEPRKRP